jgi:hypothetical protein
VLYATPLSTGWSRVMVNFEGNKTYPYQMPQVNSIPPVLRLLLNTLAKSSALNHAFTKNPIIDGDHAFVNRAVRLFRAICVQEFVYCVCHPL